MKRILKFIVASVLSLLARGVIARYRPRIVMVTGSVGKTSTKDAVAAALSARFFVRKSQKSFNTEFGVPFTILDVKDPWRNPFAWFTVMKRACALLFLPNHFPNLLVLEVGAERPGDLAKVLKIATPHMVVVTRMPEIPVHVEAYPSPSAVREEEFSPAHALAAAAPLIVPADDPYSFELSVQTPATIISYGFKKDAAVRLSDEDFHSEEGKVVGMEARVKTKEGEGKLIVRGSVGKTQLLPAAAAIAAATAFAIPLAETLEALKAFEPPAGRGRLLAGKNGSIIIDDSYNASPAAVEEALATLQAFPRVARRIAILGDMLELGRYSVMEHERIGTLAAASADIVAAVGIRAKVFASSPGTAQVFSFDDSRAAANALPDMVSPGDVVLVKGSQSIRTERIVEALLADPKDVSRLVRQDKEWKRRA